jgi:hypothetical protein
MKTTSTRIAVTGTVGVEPRMRHRLGTRAVAGMLSCCAVALGVCFFGQRLAASFIAAPVYAAGASPQAVLLGDFNGDGIPDLAVANYGTSPNYTDGGVSILLGNGDGTFQPPRSYSVGVRARSVAVGDFNRDGKLDLVTANENGTISVLLGNGDGTFHAGQSFATGFLELVAVAVGDFNSDGHLDVIVAGETKDFIDSVGVLLGNGDGTFQPAQSYPLPSAHFVAVGDFNGDGNLDIAALGGVGLNIFLGNGDGTFQPAQGYVARGFAVAVGDFNGDGIADLAVPGGTVNILIGNGDGTFQPAQPYAAGFDPRSVAAADFNHDGHVDLAVGTQYGLVSILLGNGDGTFQAPQGFATGKIAASLAVGDLNVDGHLDLASADHSGVFALLGNGDGSVQAARVYAVGDGDLSVAVGDFNGDGIPDLAVARVLNNGTLSILLGNGDGTFRAGPSYAAGDPVSVVVADFNGDGVPDLAILHYGFTTAVSILFGNGDGTFQTARYYPVESLSLASFLTAADLNGDGFPDLIATHTYGGGNTVSVLLNRGDGTFQAAQNYTVDDNPSAVAVADFNGDGYPDLAVGHNSGPNSGPLSILFGNGDGTFQAAQNYNLPTGGYSYVILAAGDFNGDGHPDLAVGNGRSPDLSVSVLLGNGDGTFEAGQKYPGYGPFGIGDFNRDGFLDLVVWQNYSSTVVLLGNGDGTFHAVPGCPVVAGGAVGDFNGDGYPDLAGSYAGGVVILLNAADWR